MTFADIEAKTTITGFSAADAAIILGVLRTAYNGSAIAKAMFDNWIATPGNTIDIQFSAGDFAAFAGTGRLILDLSFLTDNTYISPTGQAVEDTALSSIVHELGHALTGRLDDGDYITDYQGANVRFVNTIYAELGIPEQISYIAYDTDGSLHRLNYQYTNGKAIDRAESGDIDWNSSAAGVSDDLLIGGASANILQSGAGNDFLFGAGGDDNLNGGDGTEDTAVFLGNPTDYDIRQNPDGTWTSRHVRGSANEGIDTLTNLEKVQFDGGQTFDLKKEGLTFQTDFAFVIDTTGSMGDDIDAVKAQANTLINALFANNTIDARIGIVGFKDNTIGEPTSIILPFTDQDQFADRKAAALTAINGITVGGGGDLPETAFDGLLKALNGTMGAWRPGAGVQRVALFTDAAAKDGELASAVAAIAANIGATITTNSRVVGSGGTLDTFNLSPVSVSSASGRDLSTEPESSPLPPFIPTDDPQTPDTSTANLEIFTIFTGSGFVDTSDLESIAQTTGGDFLTASTGEDLVSILLKIITGTTENPILGTSGRDNLVGTAANNVITGFQGADSLTGGGGNDQFVYTSIRDRGDTITDFEVGRDQIVLTQLLDSLVTGGYNGTNAIVDGYVKVVEGSSANNFSLQIDSDGFASGDIFRPFITVNLASSGNLNNAGNFVF